MRNPEPETWIGWLAGSAAVLAITITFAYGNFETKEHAKERADMVMQRLDQIADYAKRIDEKLDRVLEERRSE